MLCRACRRQIPRAAAACAFCGRATGRGPVPLNLVLGDGTRLPITQTLTVGRARGNAIQLLDASVSRSHARIVAEPGEPPRIEDAGSSSGTFVDGRRIAGPEMLADGARIRFGDTQLQVERRRGESEAGRTIVVRPGSTLTVAAVGRHELRSPAASAGSHPRVRSGWALKRLDESEGERRFVLRDLVGGRFVRMTADDAALFELLDGTRSLSELVAQAERRAGPAGRARLAALLADLADRGLLAGTDEPEPGAGPSTRLARSLRPRELTIRWLGPLCERLYSYGGFLLLTGPALAAAAAVALAGAAAFIYFVAARYGTPFVVAGGIGLGGLVFLGGRLLVVCFHELAHGLTIVSFGRRIPRAGLKLLIVFPYAFVDTSEAWFEPRGRRLAISGAGPASDLAFGGAFSLVALRVDGTLRDVLFNVAFAAYVGAFFNLNPVLDRDGYHVLVDILREPGLRRRSRQWLVGRLAGSELPGRSSRAMRIYAAATALWSLSGLAFALVLTVRYYDTLVALAPRGVVLGVFAAAYGVALLPFAVVVGWPLAERLRRRSAGVFSAAP